MPSACVTVQGTLKSVAPRTSETKTSIRFVEERLPVPFNDALKYPVKTAADILQVTMVDAPRVKLPPLGEMMVSVAVSLREAARRTTYLCVRLTTR